MTSILYKSTVSTTLPVSESRKCFLKYQSRERGLGQINGVLTYSTFIGPCIVIYFYSKTNQMHQCLKFILFGATLHLEVCHRRCVCENWKGYVVKHNYVT